MPTITKRTRFGSAYISVRIPPTFFPFSSKSFGHFSSGLSPELKWPNDLLLNGKKVGGILTEMHAEPNVVRFVIVGIGINVNQEHFPSELTTIATSIRKESGRQSYRLELLARLLTQFESDYNRFLHEG